MTSTESGATNPIGSAEPPQVGEIPIPDTDQAMAILASVRNALRIQTQTDQPSRRLSSLGQARRYRLI